MAATAITPTALTATSLTADPAGTTYDVSNGMTIANAKPELTIFRLTNTDDDTALNVVFKAGDNPPALAAGQGDLTLTIPFGTTKWVGPLDSSRFMQSDGSLSITATVNTGKISAFLVSRDI